MLTIYCGDHSAESRRAFADARASYIGKGYECIDIDASDSTGLSTSIDSSASLFASKQIFCIENVLSKKAIRDNLKKYNESQDIDILIWEGTYDDRSIKRYFPKAKIHVSPLPVTIWKFLDGVYPGNMKLSILSLNALTQTLDELMILYMLQQRTKELILVENNLPGKIARAPWQEGRLRSQAKHWEQKHLEQFYQKLFDIELGLKTGTLPYPIHKALDILFCFYLQ